MPSFCDHFVLHLVYVELLNPLQVAIHHLLAELFSSILMNKNTKSFQSNYWAKYTLLLRLNPGLMRIRLIRKDKKKREETARPTSCGGNSNCSMCRHLSELSIEETELNKQITNVRSQNVLSDRLSIIHPGTTLSHRIRVLTAACQESSTSVFSFLLWRLSSTTNTHKGTDELIAHTNSRHV